ncbi:MAG TPA: nodulation protein NfeD [Oligoflexia bacterium]|nr:nodulation protein NfeD [Oligoflexia bacterium]
MMERFCARKAWYALRGNARRGLSISLAGALLSLFLLGAALQHKPAWSADDARPVVTVTIDGPINPAADDYLKTSLAYAAQRNARLFVLQLNTPGGLLTSMQKMVESLLEAKVPTVVYVSPRGGSATSAGVFVTLAANFAVMAPGTTIGAAHPVMGTGGDVEGKMGEKVENFTVSLIKAIAEQRGRNAAWAEKAVRESVSVTDRQALDEKIIDFIASDVDDLLRQLEERQVKIGDEEKRLAGLAGAPRESVPMSFKQRVVNVLSDPNVAILLGLGAMLGLGIELYHPGAIFPGIFGAICLVLSLTAAQVLPISLGGVALLVLSVVFFTVELFMPSFGIWGASGIVCLILGAIYFVDTELVWSVDGFSVDKGLIGSVAGIVGALLLAVIYLAISATQRKVTTGQEGMAGKAGTVKVGFTPDASGGQSRGKVEVNGEIWKARCVSGTPQAGERIRVVAAEEGLQLLVELSKEDKA